MGKPIDDEGVTRFRTQVEWAVTDALRREGVFFAVDLELRRQSSDNGFEGLRPIFFCSEEQSQQVVLSQRNLPRRIAADDALSVPAMTASRAARHDPKDPVRAGSPFLPARRRNASCFREPPWCLPTDPGLR